MRTPVLATETEGETSVGVLEREETATKPESSDGDGDRFAHYVRKDKVAASAISGAPVVALCGKVWVPGRDPKNYPVCPTCKQIMEELTGGGRGGPRWPFNWGGGR
ncbi:MAG: DUF3039 domain-containing protein [Buchananella hordeovulneris]|nr:DUF3039 domain-containing protein [Buchananella hordeovulneris]